MKQGWAGRGLWCLAVLGAALVPAWAGDSLWGQVTAVKEPTLVTLDYGTGSYEIRIVGVDAPRDGALKAQALKFVSDLVLNKNARMRLVRRGEGDDQLICRLFTDDAVIGIKEVGVELLRAGLATRQPGYEEKYGELAAAESEARAAGRGIWAAAQSK